MVGYVTLGSNDFDRAIAFYDELLAELGAKQFMGDERIVAWGTSPEKGMLAICKPHNEKEASIGNGVMVALQAESKEQVNSIHAKALALGGADEGAPGFRSDAFYGGYFRDLDGNKLVAFCFSQES